MEQMQPEEIQKLAEEQSSASSIKNPLEIEHDEYDILEGCPRSMKIAGVDITRKAFVHNQYSTFAYLVSNYGYGVCETEAQVDALKLSELYTFCAINFVGMTSGDPTMPSFEQFLYEFMEQPEGSPQIVFEKITDDEFIKFFGILIEQNNLVRSAKTIIKKKLRTEALIRQASIRSKKA